jgi:hypothetical protein
MSGRIKENQALWTVKEIMTIFCESFDFPGKNNCFLQRFFAPNFLRNTFKTNRLRSETIFLAAQIEPTSRNTEAEIIQSLIEELNTELKRHL